MIIATDVIKRGVDDTTGKEVFSATLNADTQAEVSALGNTATNVQGIEDGSILMPLLTIAITRDFSTGKLGSDGAWYF